MTSPIAVWDFRVTCGVLTPTDIFTSLEGIAKMFTFQLEEGDSGYRHYQGRLSLIKKRRIAEKHIILSLFDGKPFKPEYLAPTVNSNALKGDLFYVMKEDTRIDGPWTEKDVPKEIYVPAQYRNVSVDMLYPFQQTIWNSVVNYRVDSRTINLLYCPKGNKGKLTIAHMCRLLQGCLVIPAIINDAKELVQVACDMCMDRELRNPKAVFIDMPRAINKERLYGLYSAVETIKDGYLYDCRHHFKSWDIDSPQVWVFTNKEPDLSMLSQDRWNVFVLDENKALMPHEITLDE